MRKHEIFINFIVYFCLYTALHIMHLTDAGKIESTARGKNMKGERWKIDTYPADYFVCFRHAINREIINHIKNSRQKYTQDRRSASPRDSSVVKLTSSVIDASESLSRLFATFFPDSRVCASSMLLAACSRGKLMLVRRKVLV